MTDDDKALVERLRWSDGWFFENPWDHVVYASDDPLEAADRIETLNAMLKAAEESLGDQLAARKEQADLIEAQAAEIERLRAVVNDLLTRFDAWSPHDHDAVKNAKKALGETE
jgi:hypothetical protein